MIGHGALILQDPQEDAERGHGLHLLIFTKTLNQGKEVPADCLQGLLRLRRLHQGETAQGLLGQVPVQKLFLNRFKDHPALPLEVDQKVMDALGENAYPPQTPHVGTDMNRIDPLLGGIHPKHLRQGFRRRVKKLSIQTLFRNHMTEHPECLAAQILGIIRLSGNIQGGNATEY